MRGTHLGREDETVRPGIIPAYAGNTRDARGRIRPDGDHPRVCGEHLGLAIPPELERGSSPRMRGTPAIHIVTEVLFGIIPAYAGNTSDINTCTFTGRDHPRVCGEHHWSTSWLCRRSGSSPRMRGTRCRRTVRGSRARIIPAYAGNTPKMAVTRLPCRDHPRVCGEHTGSKHHASNPTGSSPRMRGTRTYVHQWLPCFGIIPAYAGNTAWPTLVTPSIRDHPRVCGEHPIAHIPRHVAQGSSPRMRGTQQAQ